MRTSEVLDPLAPTARLEEFLASEHPGTPYVVVDLDVVRDRYLDLVAAVPDAAVFYAVKANPAPIILELLVGLGASFDVASPAEVDVVLAAGADPSRISYGNTVKKEQWIRDAFDKGVRIFAIDSDVELAKVARTAPGSTVFCRMLCDGSGADWPLSRKFGCEPRSRRRCCSPPPAPASASGCRSTSGRSSATCTRGAERSRPSPTSTPGSRAHDVEPTVVNIGGGFPGRYRRRDSRARARTARRSPRRCAPVSVRNCRS